jgi:glycosyltransferase involved in cell wall biosynthesis
MNVLRHIDRKQLHMDFLVHTTKPGVFDKEIRALGSKVIPCLSPSQPRQYAYNFKRIIQQEGRYDIVHSHVHYFSGYIMRLAQQNGIPVRIVHAHTNTSLQDNQANLLRRFYLSLMQIWIAHHGTLGLGVSHEAATALFNSPYGRSLNWQTFFCGINLEEFYQPLDLRKTRDEFGISQEAFVIGHVGRFVEPKNHIFLLEVAAEVLRQQPNTVLFLVGDGPLRSQIEDRIKQLGIAESVILTGMRSDVSRLMRGVMDIFILPSFYEGLGLVLIEAQAAGLPCIFSDAVPNEAEVITELTERLSLRDGARNWAKTVLKNANTKLFKETETALDIIKKTDFNIVISAQKLLDLYEKSVSNSRK